MTDVPGSLEKQCSFYKGFKY